MKNVHSFVRAASLVTRPCDASRVFAGQSVRSSHINHTRIAAKSALGRHIKSISFLLVLAGFSLTAPVPAATLTVTNSNDSGPGTLRQAIQTAAAADTINFAITGVITLTNGQLLITNNLSIVGPGATNLALSANTNSRIFEIGSSVTVSISGLTLRDGYAGSGTNGGSSAPGGIGTNGGGIYNAGNLALAGCTLSGNHAGSGGTGGPGSSPGTRGGNGGNGGGIYNAGKLTLAGCTLSGNHAGSGGTGGSSGGNNNGGNGGNGGEGGAIFSTGVLAVIACTFSTNQAGTGGKGGVDALFDGGPGGNGGEGGAIYSAGALAATNSTFSSNTAGPGGAGGIGIGACVGPGGDGGNGGGIYSTNVLTLIACAFSGNSGGNGAGNLNGCNFYVGGQGGSGGGIFNAASASSVALRNTLVGLNSVGVGGLGTHFGTNSSPSGANGTGPDLAGSFTSQGHNLVGQTNGATGFADGVNADLAGSSAAPLDPKLGPLQDNGGPTWTQALLEGSPAQDAGDDALLAPPFNLLTDQRGFARKIGPHVDIGPIESQPVVTTLAATGVTATNASLNGVVNPHGAATTVYFQYGLTTSYGSFSSFNTLTATNTAQSVSNLITGLAPGTTYHFQLVGSNSFGAGFGADLTFTTSAGVPTVTTLAASSVTATNATLNGTLTTGGLNTSAYFRYGLTTSYGSYSATNALVATNTTRSVSKVISNLTPGKAYHFRLVASNSAGTGLGNDLIFTTASGLTLTNPYGQAVLADHPIGYWRLDETNGSVAFDYFGANSGFYTNALLGQPGNTNVDAHTAVKFGSVSNANSYVGGVPISFATAGNATFSIECWVNGGPQTNDCGIITRGTGGGEQFNLDCGSASHAFRFLVRDGAGGAHAASGTVTPDNTWHHLVGVCEEANGKVILYVDGISNASGTITAGSGLLNSANATTFGSRQSGAGAYDLQFVGSLEEVAIYTNALSSAQVSAHYAAGTDRPTATNLSAPETYTEDTPLNLINIVVSDGDSSNVTATLILSTTNAGSLSTATSGTVSSTYNAATGVWTASGPIANVNVLLAGVTFTPSVNFNANFTIATSVTDGFLPATTGSKAMTGVAVNDPPTLNAIANPAAINEDAGLQTVNLGGITAGGGESQTLTVTATSGNTNLIPNPTVTYSSPNTTGSLSYKAVTNASGTALITVTVNDGGASNNITTQTFTVTVNPVNDPPTLNAIANPAAINEDAGLQTVNLNGITAGGGESQTLTVTATSGNTNLIPNPTVTYSTPNTNGFLTYKPLTNANGTALITVTVNDGGASNNITTRTFTVTVNPVNDMPVFTKGPNQSLPYRATNAQTVVNWATGIDDGDPELTQSLSFNLTNSNPAIFATPPSVSSNGTLTYRPNGTGGTATIGVSLTDDAAAGGPALTTAVQTFTITVATTPPRPVINSSTLLSNGAFRLTFTDTNNILFSVLGTTNLSLPASNWTVLGTTTNIGGGLHGFTDSAATNFWNRYYLLRFP